MKLKNHDNRRKNIKSKINYFLFKNTYIKAHLNKF